MGLQLARLSPSFLVKGQDDFWPLFRLKAQSILFLDAKSRKVHSRQTGSSIHEMTSETLQMEITSIHCVLYVLASCSFHLISKKTLKSDLMFSTSERLEFHKGKQLFKFTKQLNAGAQDENQICLIQHFPLTTFTFYSKVSFYSSVFLFLFLFFLTRLLGLKS